MARNAIGLKFDGWTEYMDNLRKLGGTTAMRKGVEAGLKASKEHVNGKIEKAMSQLPAGGKYSKGRTVRSIDTDVNVKWEASTGEIKIGFDLKKSGLTSIFLMYGTPRMKPVKGLYEAIYGDDTQKEIAEIQQKEVEKVIKDVMGG